MQNTLNLSQGSLKKLTKKINIKTIYSKTTQIKLTFDVFFGEILQNNAHLLDKLLCQSAYQYCSDKHTFYTNLCVFLSSYA